VHFIHSLAGRLVSTCLVGDEKDEPDFRGEKSEAEVRYAKHLSAVNVEDAC
jgi:hypothetical protein